MEFMDFNFLILLEPQNLIAIVGGTTFGLLLGSIPGLGSMILLALLLPFTYFLNPAAAILIMLAAYQAGEYGGSISSIILGIPGTPSAAATLLDGNTLARNESPGRALAYSLQGSLVGALCGGLILVFLSEPLAKFALRWSSPEYFLIGVLGIIAVATLSSKDIIKSVISVILGMMASTVGIDIFSGLHRFTMGYAELMHGLSIIALIIGVFGIPEILSMMTEKENPNKLKLENMSGKLEIRERLQVGRSTIFGGLIGSIVGIFPGLGAGTSSWFGYAIAKKTSRHPETFGTGNPNGIVGAESANNASVGGAMLPMLTLGIPGSPAIAITMGAFIMQGIEPGPGVFRDEKLLVYTILFGFLLSSFVMFGIGRLLTPIFARIVIIPNHILAPIVLIVTIVGIYVSEMLIFNLWIALIVGVAAFFMKKLDYSAPSFVLAFILGPIIERNFRRSLQMSGGDLSIFVQRTISVVILFVIFVFIFYPIASRTYRYLKKRKERLIINNREEQR